MQLGTLKGYEMTETEERVLAGGHGHHRPLKDKVRVARSKLANASRVYGSESNLDYYRRDLSAAKIDRVLREELAQPWGLTFEQRQELVELLVTYGSWGKGEARA